MVRTLTTILGLAKARTHGPLILNRARDTLRLPTNLLPRSYLSSLVSQSAQLS